MKKLFFLMLFILSTLKINAQDTSAYEIQRAKINALLAQRSANFGQYDASLNARTGIFGFQTKRDIKNSNEILRQIALNDNDIFKELKILLDYKDLQVEQVKTAVNSNSESILNYRKTIKGLQDQNEGLSNYLEKAESASSIAHIFMFVFLICCAILAYVLYNKNKKLKQYEKASI
ncbi:hypothetical protein EZ428_14990 [Pedobacter frigiditerrae]|uniref:Uncharacterized protein n=1 Tax=Pedobacter frigiditerrae TaxID=2530452 RepID=A0A4R0MU51_9SPHI|nr:hypothetical protein EZ428_14990 [Pedobacter frigiditerrae]